jgi:hypothetical protein
MTHKNRKNKFFFSYWGARVCWPHLLDSNSESCRAVANRQVPKKVNKCCLLRAKASLVA